MKSEDKLELYTGFIDQMKREGFSPEYIGKELAIIVHAIFNPDKER